MSNLTNMNINSNYENNKLELSKLKTGCCYKRLLREYENLNNKYPNNTIVYTNDAEITITIFEKDGNKIHNFMFIITENDCYPFKSPKIFYNNNTYFKFLMTNNTHITNILKKIKGMDCMCCHSFNCSNNWTPAITIDKIIDEIKMFRNYKRDIIYKIIADKIKRRYLIEDINIDEYLF